MVTAFFRALAFVITGSQDEHLELRAIATSYMQHNAENLSCYLNAHKTIDEYLARTDLHSSSVWAMEVENFAVSNMLRTPIMVFCQSGHSYKWLHFLPHPCEDSNVVHAHSKEAVYLVNTCDHYEPVRRECDIGLAHIY